MRQAGTVTSQQDAERFVNYLVTLGISSKAEPASEGWAIWIHDENQLPRSKQELEKFQLAPRDQRYVAAEDTARQVLREAAEKKRQAQKNYVDMRNVWASPWHRRPVTLALIAVSVLATFHMFGVPRDLLLFSRPEIEQGEVWRLVTPIFVHFSMPHIIFNMWWLYDLGTIIERRLGSVLLLLLVVAIAVPSNVAQYLVSGPGFGGMSGVVYGLFGYCWVRGRLNPTSGLYLRPDVALWMMGWFFFCMTGYAGPIANWAHGVGLAAGAVFGGLSEIRRWLR